jgi:hypothetical protein
VEAQLEVDDFAPVARSLRRADLVPDRACAGIPALLGARGREFGVPPVLAARGVSMVLNTPIATPHTVRTPNSARGGQERQAGPGRPGTVLDTLETDHDYLLEGGVFAPDVIETWISYKRENEIDPLRLRPHPYDFALHYDV